MDTYLRPWFSVNTSQMEVDGSLFSKSLENNDPQVAKKLYVDLGISQTAVCRPWYVLFALLCRLLMVLSGSHHFSRNRYQLSIFTGCGIFSFTKVRFRPDYRSTARSQCYRRRILIPHWSGRYPLLSSLHALINQRSGGT